MFDFTKFLLILQMVPAIISIVRQVEQAIPGKGKGAAKLDMVLNTVQAAMSVAPEIAQHVDAVRQSVTTIVNQTVKTFNDAGVFTK